MKIDAILEIRGTGVSPGIAVGHAVKIEREADTESRSLFAPVNVNAELQRFETALKAACDALSELCQQRGGIPKKDLEIFEAQQLILEDEEFQNSVVQAIKEASLCAEVAVHDTAEKISLQFEKMQDEYFRQRAADVLDVGNRVVQILKGRTETDWRSGLTAQSIIVAEDLSPSDTVQLDKALICGLITGKGGKTAHAAILARAMGIPAVVSAGTDIDSIKNGDTLILDGSAGLAFCRPDAAMLKEYQLKLQECRMMMAEKKKMLLRLPAETKDGLQKILLMANIASPEEACVAAESGAMGIGLFRTEFLFMDRSEMPDEDVQFRAYRAAAEAMQAAPLTIRTLDIGGDKGLSYLHTEKEDNPFLGCRAIRLCLREKSLFRTHLRAILRAAIYGNVQIMFPMISSLDELRAAKSALEEAKQSLKEDGIAYAEHPLVGMMVEIPSAAIAADLFAAEVDFFSIGSNDLIQYTTAVDRMNGQIANLYDGTNPAVIRLIKMTIDAANAAKIPVCMCGEMAGDPAMTKLLLGLGLRSFSVTSSGLLAVKEMIRSTSMSDACREAERALRLPVKSVDPSFNADREECTT